MTRLEDLTKNARVRGILPDQVVTIRAVDSYGENAVSVTYRRNDGEVGEQVLYRDNEKDLTIVTGEPRWPFDADGAKFRLLSEVYRVRLAHLFDPMLAVHTSMIEPLPHQITAVYHEMLNRQPLRYLLADDPGAGKTIMAGLLLRELVVRGDVRRCLICAPGNLTEQWQDEMRAKFQLEFSILSRDMIRNARTGNPFAEHDLLIVRLDLVSRDDDLKAQLQQTDWDLVICDEAHKMSASYFAGDLKETRRRKLGVLLGKISRHFLLMSATPHNGKEEEFHLFMALLDADRFEGQFRDKTARVDVSDLMRRMIKENLRKFDGAPLFPERRAYTINYALSPEEQSLYDAVTGYVRGEFNRADKLEKKGRKGTVGFALTVLQRRLASSPEAISQSLSRRRKRLEKKLQDALDAHKDTTDNKDEKDSDEKSWDDYEDGLNLDANPNHQELVDGATAARTIEEFQKEIEALNKLEIQAQKLRQSGTDYKWIELSRLLQNTPEMQGHDGAQRKLVIFTEHRDTLNYLKSRLITLTSQPDSVVCIHGAMGHDERRTNEVAFRNDPTVAILVATDAAGEGINLQRAHLMVNYDLPWNPNRLEQRFGRIHRIGQTEVCHLWNLVAGETREGAVYTRLLEKLTIERNALNGQVFDILGNLFQDTSLRNLLIEAVRYGDDPKTRANLYKIIDNSTDRTHAQALLQQGALAETRMDTNQITSIRADMERAAARRLQPHYIRSVFIDAFRALGNTLYEREPGRYQIHSVLANIRNYAKDYRLGAVAPKYERICFEKSLINVLGKPQAEFICPGHPLFDATLILLDARENDILKCGSVLVDPHDFSTVRRILFYIEHTLNDALPTKDGKPRAISRELHFLEIDENKNVREAGGAPYLDYRPATAEELALPAVSQWVSAASKHSAASETKIIEDAVKNLVPRHLGPVRDRRLALIAKTEAAVEKRLTSEIKYRNRKAHEMQIAERAGNAKGPLNSQREYQRANELEKRLQQRREQLKQEREIKPTLPIIISAALIVPAGLLTDVAATPDRQRVEAMAMQAVMNAERKLGHTPTDVSQHNFGYDIESVDARSQALRFIEVKGRRADADTITVTRNEVLAALNAPEQFILAIVTVDSGQVRDLRYVRKPFAKEPDFSVTSLNYTMRELLALSSDPA
jgi:superfamily II DNA or RNA helicase